MSKRADIGEEVVEMKEDVDGTYKSTAIVKVNPSQPVSTRLDTSHHSKRIPMALEFLGGFVMGLEALENFMVNMKRLGRGKRIKNVVD